MSVSLINGHIDPEFSPEQRFTMLNDELEELVDSFYDGVYLCQSKEIDGEEIMLEGAIYELLRKYKDIVSIISIETDTCFSNPSTFSKALVAFNAASRVILITFLFLFFITYILYHKI